MNTNCKAIHETVLKDIMDLWDEVKGIAKSGELPIGKKKTSPMSRASSIARASSNLVLVFPVLCSKNISISTASMISKAVEKNSVSMLQKLFASWQIADDGIDNVQDYINRFHKNISAGSRGVSLDDIFRAAEGIDNFVDTGDLSFKAEAAIREDMENINFHLPDAINEFTVEDIYSEEVTSFGSKSREQISKIVKDTIKEYSPEAEAKAAAATAKGLVDNRTAMDKQYNMFKNQVLDSDYKKANELMPTNMIVNFAVTKDGQKIADVSEGIIGVKAKLYPIGSADIITHIADKTISKNWITNFVRASTREISFMKDLVLAIDKAKIDAMSLSVRNSTSDKMWKVLERRALKARLRKAMNQGYDASAITTLCVSQDEVEYLRKNYHVDLESISTVLRLFESLNLMCICIVDESLEVAKFIYDEEDPMWETISFTHLEREVSDGTYKKVVNLMTKMSR